jgi:hypothetical protein
MLSGALQETVQEIERDSMGGAIMRTYKMRGLNLYNTQNRKIAITRGESIYDASYRRVGAIRGDDLFDSDGRIMMTVRDRDIYDSDNRKVGGIADVRESIEGITEGMLRTSLWYCFVR